MPPDQEGLCCLWREQLTVLGGQAYWLTNEQPDLGMGGGRAVRSKTADREGPYSFRQEQLTASGWWVLSVDGGVTNFGSPAGRLLAVSAGKSVPAGWERGNIDECYICWETNVRWTEEETDKCYIRWETSARWTEESRDKYIVCLL